MYTNVIASSWDRALNKYILLQHENCLNSLKRMDCLLQSWKAFEWKIHSVLHEHEFKKKWEITFTFWHIFISPNYQRFFCEINLRPYFFDKVFFSLTCQKMKKLRYMCIIMSHKLHVIRCWEYVQTVPALAWDSNTRTLASSRLTLVDKWDKALMWSSSS